MQRRLFIFKVSFPHRHPGIRSGSSVFVRRDLPALHASRALSWFFFCVRLCLPSPLYVMSYTLFRALYDEFLAGCCYVSHTFAVGFPMPLRVCYTAGFHMHFVICSPMHASRAFTLRPFYFSCVSLYIVPSISPDRIPCVFVRVHSTWAPNVFFYSLHRAFLESFPLYSQGIILHCGFPMFLFVRYFVLLLRELQFTLFPMCFPLVLRAFSLICVHVFLYFHMNSLMVLSAIVLVPSLFLSFLFIPHAFPSAFHIFGFIFS